MDKIKYKKGDYIKEISSSGIYFFKVIKDIPLELWEDKDSYIGRKYIKNTENEEILLFNKADLFRYNAKQYKVNYMNTALYKILHKGE